MDASSSIKENTVASMRLVVPEPLFGYFTPCEGGKSTERERTSVYELIMKCGTVDLNGLTPSFSTLSVRSKFNVVEGRSLSTICQYVWRSPAVAGMRTSIFTDATKIWRYCIKVLL